MGWNREEQQLGLYERVSHFFISSCNITHLTLNVRASRHPKQFSQGRL